MARFQCLSEFFPLCIFCFKHKPVLTGKEMSYQMFDLLQLRSDFLFANRWQHHTVIMNSTEWKSAAGPFGPLGSMFSLLWGNSSLQQLTNAHTDVKKEGSSTTEPACLNVCTFYLVLVYNCFNSSTQMNKALLFCQGWNRQKQLLILTMSSQFSSRFIFA